VTLLGALRVSAIDGVAQPALHELAVSRPRHNSSL
jgi:hypothetical protein